MLVGNGLVDNNCEVVVAADVIDEIVEDELDGNPDVEPVIVVCAVVFVRICTAVEYTGIVITVVEDW
jgi:hypothetical protein